jgi:DNA-binding Lrp family transcriptional regulator
MKRKLEKKGYLQEIHPKIRKYAVNFEEKKKTENMREIYKKNQEICEKFMKKIRKNARNL